LGVLPGTGIPAFVSFMKYFCTLLATCEEEEQRFGKQKELALKSLVKLSNHGFLMFRLL